MPDRGRGGVIRVEGIDAVMRGRYDDHVMHGACYGDIGKEERLRVNSAIYRVGGDTSKARTIDIGFVQNGLVGILSEQLLTVLIQWHRSVRRRRRESFPEGEIR